MSKLSYDQLTPEKQFLTDIKQEIGRIQISCCNKLFTAQACLETYRRELPGYKKGEFNENNEALIHAVHELIDVTINVIFDKMNQLEFSLENAIGNEEND